MTDFEKTYFIGIVNDGKVVAVDTHTQTPPRHTIPWVIEYLDKIAPLQGGDKRVMVEVQPSTLTLREQIADLRQVIEEAEETNEPGPLLLRMKQKVMELTEAQFNEILDAP